MNADECSDYWLNRDAGLAGGSKTSEELTRINRLQEEAIDRILDSFQWKTLLEVGCGFGRHVLRTKRRYPDRRVIGVDIAKNRLKHIQQQDSRVEVIRCNAFDGIPALKADVALTSEFMMHIPPENLPKVYKSIRAVAQKVVMLEYCVPERFGEVLASHNWNHDYPRLIEGFLYVQGVSGTEDILFKNWRD